MDEVDLKASLDRIDADLLNLVGVANAAAKLIKTAQGCHVDGEDLWALRKAVARWLLPAHACPHGKPCPPVPGEADCAECKAKGLPPAPEAR